VGAGEKAGILLFNGKPQATALNVVAGLKRSRLRLAVKKRFLPRRPSELEP
jgi:hypothetical protein